MSKVLMAFLGTNKYTPCNYVLNEQEKVNNVKYIQEALVSLLCKDWTADDRIVIFLTKDAKGMNWVDNGYTDKEGKPNIGLETKLRTLKESLKLKANIVPKDIPEGKKEEEIRKIFEDVLYQINENDKIIFDITHAFRSIPMLAIIILNYAKVLKNIKINGVYYGAFESLGPIQEVKKMKLEDRNAPIFDLTPFVRLFDWTNATANFLTYGDAKDINELTDENAQNSKNLSDQLKNLTEIIKTCRGLTIVSDFDFKNLKELVEINKKSSDINLLNPLLDKISIKINNFANNDIKNGYAGVEWCLKHNLIHQGYTLLQETMINEIFTKHFGNNKLENYHKRELVRQAFYIKKKNLPVDEWKGPAKQNIQLVNKIVDSLDESYVNIFSEISNDRNDIDHAGFREKPLTATELKDNLKKYYEKLKRGAKDV